ncbi:ABC transporter ATP-binding protein [Bacillus sp. B15-48]|uniref:ABC transporter ATP-binding protein n=1 Tax=Bacillus sp. B15-48 TaxID=1548601 RepID=UPI0031B80EDA
MREFEGYEGGISIGGRAIQDYQLDTLREAIGYVPQEHVLFSATVAENIAFAETNTPKEKIHEAARIAYIHDVEA